MSLSPGRKIGPYDVVAPLGAGGMGEVYRARDSRLDRDVAIKILPDSFAGDTDRLARFEREAKALAALNHPNIAAIYGIEIAAETGTRALVMELVEGDDLSEHIARGAMPLAEVLPVARQIAEALEAAHEQGIVHRDLKPANVKVRQDGTIKVLDFGLAKIWSHDGGSGTSAPSSSPTLTTAAPFGVGSGGPEHSRGATHDGMIIGTAAYMAPEQAKGKSVDKRADVWAFGVVLYEMLTGRRAFEGEDISTTLATVLMKDPDWTALPPGTPPAVVALIRRCLQRDPRQRLRDIGEARWLLSNPGSLGGPPAADAAPSARTGSGRGLLAAAVAGTAVISVVATVLLSRPPPAPVIRGAIQMPRGTVYAIGPSTPMNLSVSPDGDMVAFVAMPVGGSGETSALYLRRWNEGEARLVADSQGAYMPFFAPDGQWVAFMDGTTLKKASVSGGAPRTLATGIANAWGGTWLSDGRIIYSNPSPNGDMLHEVADTGGEPRVVSRADRLDRDHSLPQGLAGDELLITIWTGGVFSDGNIARLSLETGAPGSVLVEGGSNAHALESGHLVYARGAELFAMTFRNQGDQVGAPVKVQEGVLADLSYATTQFDVSPSGVLAYAPASDAGPSASVVWVTADGQPQTVFEDPYLDAARLSPDGHTVVFQSTQSSREKDLWSYDLVAGRRSRLTSSAGEEYAAVVSPDGRSVYFAAWAATAGLYRTPLAGGVAESLAVTGDPAVTPSSFSADGRWLAVERAGANRYDIGVIDLQAGSLAVQWLAETPFVERQPRFSPTAGLVAYVSNQLGQSDVWVTAFPGKEGQSAIPVSREGGNNPFWAPDGRTLYFTAGTKLLAATVEPGDPLKVSAPKDVMVLQNLTMIGIAPDGRFLAIRREPPSVTRIEFVLNWAEELKQRVR